MVWPADFRAYGQLAAQHVEEVKNPLRFQGQYFDDESGLHYNRYRYYCPETGRFISPDPIGLAGGLNSYQYVVNPTGCVDPLGLVQGRENCPGLANKGFTEKSIFNRYPEETILKTSGIDEQVWFLTQNIPGLKAEQAQITLERAFKKDSSVVIGGSRIRGNFNSGSDLDVGFGNLTANQAGKIVDTINKQAKKNPGLEFLNLERTRIVPGNSTKSISKIDTPEEFFQRSGTRTPPDPRSPESFFPSGSVTLLPNGTIKILPPRVEL